MNIPHDVDVPTYIRRARRKLVPHQHTITAQETMPATNPPAIVRSWAPAIVMALVAVVLMVLSSFR